VFVKRPDVRIERSGDDDSFEEFLRSLEEDDKPA
jgi:hypothetical protein